LRSTATCSRADLSLPNASNSRLREENTGSCSPAPFKKSPKTPTTASFPGTKKYVSFFFSNYMKKERKTHYQCSHEQSESPTESTPLQEYALRAIESGIEQVYTSARQERPRTAENC
jgi:hypothetical protein